ncbi:multiubiquitin domain-containing protein [Sphingomonas sp. MMS24-JH45]
MTFEQIVELAFPGPHEPNVVFSMTYRKAALTPHARGAWRPRLGHH